MGTPHKHYDVIVAWAAGEEIELWGGDEWVPWLVKTPPHHLDHSYRIKPKRVKKEGWVNIYSEEPIRDICIDRRTTSLVYPNEQTADEQSCVGRVACVRIEWEEEE